MDAKSPGQVPTFRCSTIFVSEGSETHVFRSFGEMPTHMRRRISARTRGGASATIFIANHGGREELAKRLRGMPSRVETRLEEAVPPEPKPARSPEPPSFSSLTIGGGMPVMVRQALMVASGAALLVWLLSSWR
jgi:hypothetical protein